MHAEEDSLSGQRLSKDHSWRIAEISCVLESESLKKNLIQFKFICIALFTIQSLQSSFTGNYISTIYYIYIFNLWQNLVILYVV